MLRSHCQLTRGVEIDSALRAVESGIRDAGVGYPTSPTRVSDFVESGIRLGRVGYPTLTSRLADFGKWGSPFH